MKNPLRLYLTPTQRLICKEVVTAGQEPRFVFDPADPTYVELQSFLAGNTDEGGTLIPAADLSTMTRLFRAVVMVGVVPDSSNDDLMTCDAGMVWECPVDKAPNPLALLRAATALLGSVCRGVEVVTTHKDSNTPVPMVRIFLTEAYSD